MTGVFLRIVNMSISASWLVLAVLLFRLVLKKAPKWVNVLLWGIVAVRLICPFFIESALSLIPSAETIPEKVISGPSFEIQTGISPIDAPVNDYLGDHYFEGVTVPANNGSNIMMALTILWIIGVLLLIAYTVISYKRLQHKVEEAVILRDNIFQSENVASPFVMGIIKPRIYLPYHMEEQDITHVIAHEQAHIRRRDHWWKPLGFLLLTIHWFNPLMWLAYVLLCRDIELACDEKVIKELGNEQRADYTQALVACSVSRRMIAACPLAFGEVGVKERVKSVMNYKKPAFWIVLLAIVACVVVAVCFLTNPEERTQEICVNGNLYVQEGEIINELPSNSAEIGILRSVLHRTTAHPTEHLSGTNLDEKYAGCPVYQSGTKQDTIYLEDFSGFYIPFVCAESVPKVIKWFDYLPDPTEMDSKRSLDTNIAVFPDVTFRWNFMNIEAVNSAGTETLLSGMPIWSCFFSDLNGDGKPELCANASFGSGLIDQRVLVYDYAAGKSYELSDRGNYDYTLRINEEDGLLYADKRVYPYEELVCAGQLVLGNDTIQILGENTSTNAISLIIDPTDDPNFSYDTAMEKFFEDENNEYFFGGIYSQNVIIHYTDGTQENIVDALNAGRATIADLDRFDIQYKMEPKVDSLDVAISSAILEHYASEKPDGRLYVESHVLLANEAASGTPLFGNNDHAEEITVYLLVLHEKYSTYGGTLEAVGGSYIPTAITFTVSDSGEYTLKEYWEPRDGSYYPKDIQAKFPGASAEEALNDQKYIDDLQEQNLNKAKAYLNSSGSLDLRIAEVLDIIQSSPAASSNPGDYIAAHDSEYQELLGYGQYTLRYCFSEFLLGGQTDLRGHIMANICEDICGTWGEALLIDGPAPGTGQEWFESFKSNAENIANQFSDEDMEKHYPGFWLLLQMINE